MNYEKALGWSLNINIILAIVLLVLVVVKFANAQPVEPLQMTMITFTHPDSLEPIVGRFEKWADTVITPYTSSYNKEFVAHSSNSLKFFLETALPRFGEGLDRKSHLAYIDTLGDGKYIVYYDVFVYKKRTTIARRRVEFVEILPYPPDVCWTYQPPYRVLIGWRNYKEGK